MSGRGRAGRRALLLALTLGVTAAPLPLAALESGAEPAINAPYRDPDFEQWVARFERPGREVYDRRADIVAATKLQPGMAVADIGAGTGLFTRLFAERVGAAGKVYAVDVSRAFVDGILRRARTDGQRQIVGVVNTQHDAGLAPGAIDVAFICDTYHHFEQPAPTLRSIHRALRPGGALVVIDFQKIPGVSTPWVLDHVRLGKQDAIREIEAAGFRLLEDRDLLRENYFLRFARRD